MADAKTKTINIHGNLYIPVAERVRLAHEDNKDNFSILTEFIPNGGAIVCKATVTTKKGTFTGTSAANPIKVIEKQSPYEVAETSAVGRALGFAGYGIVEGIASADEVVKAQVMEIIPPTEEEEPGLRKPESKKCPVHPDKAMISKVGKYGQFYSHPLEEGGYCNGKPKKIEDVGYENNTRDL